MFARGSRMHAAFSVPFCDLTCCHDAYLRQVQCQGPGKIEPFHADLVAQAAEALSRMHVELRGSRAAAVASNKLDLERVAGGGSRRMPLAPR